MGSGMLRVVMIAAPKPRGLGKSHPYFAPLVNGHHHPSTATLEKCAFSDSHTCDSGHCFLIIMPHQMTRDWLPQ